MRWKYLHGKPQAYRYVLGRSRISDPQRFRKRLLQSAAQIKTASADPTGPALAVSFCLLPTAYCLLT
jgi:hypothetical protein